MVTLEYHGKHLYLDGYLKQNLDLIRKVIKKDWDMVFCIDGMEGCGKSTFTQQIAFYCDPTLNISRIAFDSKEFTDVVNKAGKYQACIYDEAYQGLSSRGTMSEVNRNLVSLMTTIRQKNLFVFIVMPCYFDLDKYIALWRSRALFHCYINKRMDRGFFSLYNTSRKKDLYVMGKKMYRYCVKPNFRGRFTGNYMINEEEYRQKKYESLKEKTKFDEMKKEKQSLSETKLESLIIGLLNLGYSGEAILKISTMIEKRKVRKEDIHNIKKKHEDLLKVKYGKDFFRTLPQPDKHLDKITRKMSKNKPLAKK